MDWTTSLTSGGITASIVAILYGLIKLCHNRHLILKSGCCSVDVGSDQSPPKVGFPPKPIEVAERATHYIEPVEEKVPVPPPPSV